jgi:hypothetical protein
MKNYVIITITILLLLSCGKKNKDTEIYLKVINNIEDCTDIKDCIQFSDNRGNAVSLPGKPEVFTSKVNAGKWVIWMGANDSDPKIEIIEVNFKEVTGSKNILEKTKMKEKDGIVRGKVKPKDSLHKDDIEFYSITFKINNVEYTIDPKLEYH